MYVKNFEATISRLCGGLWAGTKKNPNWEDHFLKRKATRFGAAATTDARGKGGRYQC